MLVSTGPSTIKYQEVPVFKPHQKDLGLVKASKKRTKPTKTPIIKKGEEVLPVNIDDSYFKKYFSNMPVAPPFKDTPSTIILCGNSGSGKSFVAANIILRYYKDAMDRIYIVGATTDLDPVIKKIEEGGDNKVVLVDPIRRDVNKDRTTRDILSRLEHLFKLDYFKDDQGVIRPKRTLIAFFDCQYMFGPEIGAITNYTRHFGITTIWDAHQVTKMDVVVRRNASHAILFASPDAREAASVCDLFSNIKGFENVYKDISFLTEQQITAYRKAAEEARKKGQPVPPTTGRPFLFVDKEGASLHYRMESESMPVEEDTGYFYFPDKSVTEKRMAQEAAIEAKYGKRKREQETDTADKKYPRF